MRVIHLADVHIGVENYSRPATEADVDALPAYFSPDVDRSIYVGMPTRLLDFLSTLDEAVDFALTKSADVVLFAGDAYKSRDPSQTHQREFARRVARLANNGVPVFLLVGNHDIPHIAGRASSLEIFPTLDVRNVHVGDSISTSTILTREGSLQVVALPWIRRGSFMAREEMQALSLDQITEEIESRLTDLLHQQIQKLDPSLPSILCGHVSVSGAKLSSERTMMLGKDHMLLLSTLANPIFDYVGLGHIHRHQILANSPIVSYAGSLQRVDFSEEEEEKGFCVIDLDPAQGQGNRVVSFEFHPVKARPFLTINVTVKEEQDPTEEVVKAIAKHNVVGSVVRVHVSMPSSVEPLLREREIRAALQEAGYVASIERNVVRERRTRLNEEEVAQLSPLDVLTKYLESRNTSKARTELLISHGQQLLQEELIGEHGEA
jgi:exonuclease SbcD